MNKPVKKNNKMEKKLAVMVFIFMIAVVPMFLHAEGGIAVQCEGGDCNFGDLVRLGNNIMEFLLLVSIPIATIAFAWAGILMLTAKGSADQIERAKSIFGKVLWGFLFVLTAWLIVRMITTTLLKPSYYEDLLKDSKPATLKFRPLIADIG